MNFDIISWNVNGIRSILKKGFPDFIKTHLPHLICLQEIKCDDIELIKSEFDNLGYQVKALPAIRKGYSGTLTAWNPDTNLKIKNYNDINISEEFFSEGRIIDSTFLNFRILNLYLPSGSSSEERHIKKFEFMDQFFNYLASLTKKERSNLIICGDLNICHQDRDIHHPEQATKRRLSGFLPEEREWFSKFLSLGFVDAYRILSPENKAYTWWSYRAGARKKNLGWRLDYFICSEKITDKINTCSILTEIGGSDHCPIKLSLSV